jgi:hypothetical protein
VRLQTGELLSFFRKWAETAFYFRFNMVRVKSLVSGTYKGKVGAALHTWRQVTAAKSIHGLQDVRSANQHEIQLRDATISEL